LTFCMSCKLGNERPMVKHRISLAEQLLSGDPWSGLSQISFPPQKIDV
jgi:hypothetical protein